MENRKILYVDDTEMLRIYAKKALANSAYSLDLAVNGHEGVDRAKEFDYKLIFMDIKLPDISGFEATKQILKEKPESTIIALSAYNR